MNSKPLFESKHRINQELPPKPVVPSVWDTQEGGTHYTDMVIQPFQFSMANKLDPMQHTIIKYVARFRAKGGIEDLRKAKQTIDLLIDWERTNGSKASETVSTSSNGNRQSVLCSNPVAGTPSR